MATKVFPSTNDVAPVSGDGQTLKESNLLAWLSMLVAQNFVLSGFTLPASSVDLTLSIALGEALIAGARVVKDAAETVTCTASATNHIYLKLTKDGLGNISGAVFEVNTTGVAPSNSILIAQATASDSTILQVLDKRSLSYTLSANMGSDATQSIASSTSHTILSAFNSVSWDYGGLRSSASRFTIVESGIYRITANVSWSAVTGGYRSTKIFRNSESNALATVFGAPSSVGTSKQSVSVTARLVVGDYLDVQVSQDSGSAVDVQSGTLGTRFMIERIG